MSSLPPTVQTIEEQAEQTYEQYLTNHSDLEKRHFLMEIFNTNTLVTTYFIKHIRINHVYIPTIANN
ncbi:Malolactic enzyme [Lactococcus lactis]|nr:Malolactic enzyme [Lactococcus lactis]